MINWDEVKVGETEIVGPSESHYIIVGRHADYVWVYSTLNDHNFARPLAYFEDWTIYDPWVEITDECEWVQCHHFVIGVYFVLRHFGQEVTDWNKYQVRDGRRVWTRKEG